MWVYINSEPGLWTVGFYSPDGKWHTDADYGDRDKARERVAWLNGGSPIPRSISPEDFDRLVLAMGDTR